MQGAVMEGNGKEKKKVEGGGKKEKDYSKTEGNSRKSTSRKRMRRGQDCSYRLASSFQ